MRFLEYPTQRNQGDRHVTIIRGRPPIPQTCSQNTGSPAGTCRSFTPWGLSVAPRADSLWTARATRDLAGRPFVFSHEPGHPTLRHRRRAPPARTRYGTPSATAFRACGPALSLHIHRANLLAFIRPVVPRPEGAPTGRPGRHPDGGTHIRPRQRPDRFACGIRRNAGHHNRP